MKARKLIYNAVFLRECFIHEVGARSRFIHIGSITSIIMIRCVDSFLRLMMYANGYDIRRVITVRDERIFY